MEKKKRDKSHADWKGRNKLSLFTDDIILYVESPEKSTKKLLEYVNLQRSQDTKSYRNQLDFCMLPMNSWKKNTFYNDIKT